MEKNTVNSRYAAFLALYKTENEKAYVNIALKEILQKYNLSSVDRRFITNLVYGCVRYKIRLDYVISKFSSVKLKKISDKALIILRLGIYQMMFLSRVPKSAAVNESVKLCAKVAYKSKAFVNAILRKAAENIEKIEYPKDEFLSVYYSYPSELVNFFQNEFADKTEEILKELNFEKPITIRVNTSRTNRDDLREMLNQRGIESKCTELENALYVSGTDIANSDLYKDGFFTVQGLSSMIAVNALKLEKGMCVLDMCAAPGGKTTYISELVGEKGSVYSYDIYEHKVELIKKNAERMGFENVYAALKDASVFDENLIKKADAVLVDAPCAGLGIIAKKPDIKYTYSKEAQAEIAKLQFEILKNAADYVKEGGVLVYSTCSMGSVENAENIEKFLKLRGDFVAEAANDFLPESLKTSEDARYINIMPHEGYDGFFICKMRRKQNGEK